MKINLKNIKSTHEQKHPQSITIQDIKINQRKKFVVRSNIASLIRKYASFLFK